MLAVALVYALIHSALFDIPLARAVVFVVAIKLVTSYLGHNIRALKVQLTALHEHGGVESTRTYFKYQLFKYVPVRAHPPSPLPPTNPLPNLEVCTQC